MRGSKGGALRGLLAQDRTPIKPGAFDAPSAMIIEKAGFPCRGVIGYGNAINVMRTVRDFSRPADAASRRRRTGSGLPGERPDCMTRGDTFPGLRP
jgi:2-methylisocitrate lyase-like PEP mutase family enzyme